MPARSIPITNDDAANRLLVDNPLALLIGMLLDQQVSMEWAFLGPHTLRDRLGGDLDAATIAALDPSELETIFRAKPALHRYPAAMARRTHGLCRYLVEHYDGDAARIWRHVRRGDELYRRLRELPGFGDEKARIFMAVLAKRLGRSPTGWQVAAAPFSDDRPRSVADVSSPETRDQVRDFKKLMKAQGKPKTGTPD